MIETFFWIIWGLWLLMILIAACRVAGFLFAKKKQEKLWGKGTSNQQPVAIVVAVKGFDPIATPRFFASLIAQDYSNFRILISYETGKETVARWLRDQFRLEEGEHQTWIVPESGEVTNGLKSVTLVEAGQNNHRGQKVHNQLAALETLNFDDEVVVFVDSDIVCPPNWLASLSAPINQGTHDLSTTYRWLVPKRPTFPNQLASIINASITTQGGSEWSNVLWGGSMAVSRKAFDSLNVPKLFEGSLNDDLRLSKEARKEGYSIAFVRSIILPTMVDFDWTGLFEFGRRQYTQVKFFSPILYRCTNLAMGFYVFGLLSAIVGIWLAHFPAWIPIAGAYVIDQFRAMARQGIYFSLFKEEGIRSRLTTASWMEHMLTPFWMVMHWIIIVSTWTKTKIQWAGITYKIYSPVKTEVLDRKKEVFGPVPSAAASLNIPFAKEIEQAIPALLLDTHKIGKEVESTGLSIPPDPVERVKTTPIKIADKRKKKKKKQELAKIPKREKVEIQPSPFVIALSSPLPVSKNPLRKRKAGIRAVGLHRRKQNKIRSEAKKNFTRIQARPYFRREEKPKKPVQRKVKSIPPSKTLPSAIVSRPTKAAEHVKALPGRKKIVKKKRQRVKSKRQKGRGRKSSGRKKK